MIADAFTEFTGGLFGTLLIVVVLAVIVCWIVFPFLVLQRMKELYYAQHEIVKALQWIKDNWKIKVASRRRPSESPGPRS
jgi:uncharacterized membrane protein